MLNLGKLENLPTDKHKPLADRIEEILTGTVGLYIENDSKVEALAQKFAKQIIKNGAFSPSKEEASSTTPQKNVDKNYVEVDLENAEELESRGLGGSLLAKQAFERLTIDEILTS